MSLRDDIPLPLPDAVERKPSTSLRTVKYTLLYILLIPFINWSFTWAPMVNLPGLTAWAFNPVTIVTGLVLVVRDFSQREIGHEVLLAMAIALGLTYVTSGGALALASGAAFLISELVDYALFTFTKYKLSTRVLLSSALAAPIDTTAFLYGASFIREDQLTAPNIIMSVAGKMVGAIVIWWLIRQRMEKPAKVTNPGENPMVKSKPMSVSEFLKYVKQNPDEFRQPEYKKPMDPPWIAFPDYDKYSMGWRMGGGEDYIHAYKNWLKSLRDEEAAKYIGQNPESDEWSGFYKSILQKNI